MGTWAERFPDATLGLVGEWNWVAVFGPYGQSMVKNQEKRLTLGLVFRPTDHVAFKVNFEENRATIMALYRGNRRDWLTAVGAVF